MNYKYILGFFLFIAHFNPLQAQKIEEIYFNLYTDSLKKGTFNYINVDAKLSNGKWMPLSEKELNFFSSVGYFKANSLWIEDTVSLDKVAVSIQLKSDTSFKKSIDIYIKISTDWGNVVQPEEVISPTKPNRRKRN